MSRIFCNNPWGLSTNEVESLWLLAAFERTEAERRLGVGSTGFSQRLMRAREKMDAATTTVAVVELDRWWQGAKRGVADVYVHRLELELLEPVAT